MLQKIYQREYQKYVTVDFKYDGKKETYDLCIGMPVIATTNIKDQNIYNTMEFVIEELKEKEYKINNQWYNQKELSECFIPSFCATVYKYQGADINENYNIYDCNRMDKKQLYTALSWTTKFEYIHIDNKTLNNNYFMRVGRLAWVRQ